MMPALLLSAYSQGLYASRRIAKACEERVDVMAVTARQQPDFRTISDVRKRHLSALGGLFTQVLQLCQKAGLVRLGHVALDGTKIRAHASTHKAMSDSRMQTTEPALAAEVAQWLAHAAASAAREDAAYGVDRRGDEWPKWVTHKQHRVEKIRAAKAALAAEAQDDARGKKRTADPQTDRPRRGRPAKHPSGTPHARAQDGFIQGDHAQAAVDAAHQVIVAHGLTSQASDAHQLEPMLAHIKTNTGRQARERSADAGDCSEQNLTMLARRHGSAPARRGLGHRQTEDRPENASPRHEDSPDTRRVSQSLSAAKAGGRTRVWPDQTGTWFSAVLVAGPGAGRWGVECTLSCPPHAETGRCERMNPFKSVTAPSVGTRIDHTLRRLTESPLALP